ncbi:MAG: Uncharacterized protein CEN91_169 [Candidatus Berkelbacteria bacterium Licking1014_85]|uniref:Uncharacterized protein n=1 Tax=Candidatus Berkelbacteria bacterium Licking1014_85 TaxID=2017148 RepID=A0A554LL85_9BACT|nr:MAG: Uncharacterized protein CEN91_169 [Candidatus Berkelbacteria bacterium Licking1014_85]
MILNTIKDWVVGRVIAAEAAGFDKYNPLQGATPTIPGKFGTLPSLIGFVFEFIIGISGAIFVILLLVGGIQYLTGAGNDEQTGKAKKLMIDSIIGLVIVLAAWAIGTFVLDKFGYNI